MKLEEYFEKTGIPVAKFAARCGITYAKLRHIRNGNMPSLDTALKICKQTGNEVTLQMLYDEVVSNKGAKYR